MKYNRKGSSKDGLFLEKTTMILPSILTETRAAVNLAAVYIKREIVKVTTADIEEKDLNSLVSFVDKGS